jgi:hypothetical protein
VCQEIEIAAKRAQTGGPIVAAAAMNPNSVAPGFATQFCDVEVDPDTAPDLAKGAAMSRNTSVILFRQPDALDDARSGRARGRRLSNAGASVGC